MTVNDDFQLGKHSELICDTCHGIKDLDQIPLEKVDKQAKNFLRNGSYKNLIKFCYNCHESKFEQKNMQRFNIHIMLDKQGRLIEKNCTYCHAEVPDPEKDTDWSKLQFVLEPEKLCLGCHLKTSHLNSIQHQVEPSEKVLKQLQKTEQEKNIILPLNKQGDMMCVTCHTPHQRGIIDPDNPGGHQVEQNPVEEGIKYSEKNRWSRVFYEDKLQRFTEMQEQHEGLEFPQYLPVQAEILLRLPAKNGQLCLACHNFKD